MGFHRLLFLTLLAAASTSLCPRQALAWGPHTEIAQAALDAMGPEDPLIKHLGAADAKRLAQYVWMADWRQQLMVRADEVFYSDDVLLFPAAPKHYEHICPAVKSTYVPYFRRALQALRTESPHNAARWVGSLLHFTTDTGSPPHAAEINGPVHSKMENWLKAALIHLPGYQPQLLGADDATAEAGYLQRMDGLIAFSKERAQRCRADLDADRRDAVEPVVLESALETARVTADLLHTLGVLAAQPASGSTLTGKIIGPKIDHISLSRLPVKIILVGTLYSTLTGPDGSFSFQHLPTGDYKYVISAPGYVSEPQSVCVNTAGLALYPIDLSAQGDGNLIRNPSFALRWVKPDGFDHRNFRSYFAKLASKTPERDWEGEWIPLQKDVQYQLTAKWKAGDGRVFVRTKAKPEYGSLATDSAALSPGVQEVIVTGTAEAAWAQVCIRAPQPPDVVLENVMLRAVK